MQFVKNFLIRHRTRLYLYTSKFLSQKQYWNLVAKISPFDAILDNYFDKKSFFETGKKIKRFFEKEKLINRKSKTLHIGCGIGRIEKHLYKNILECHGIDISESMIKQAKENLKSKNVFFYSTNGYKLTYQDNYFDFIYSFLVFQHMPTVLFKKNLREAKRVLKPDGKFLFQIPLDEKDIKEIPSKNNPWLMRYYKRSFILSLIQKMGFKLLKTFNGFEKDNPKLTLQPEFTILVKKIS